MSLIEIAVLGPVRLSVGSRPVSLPTVKSRAVLALLALRANTPVDLEEMRARVWDTRPPPTAIAALRNNVSTLRKAFAGAPRARIETSERGYTLRVEPDALDTEQFDRLLDRGARALRADQPEEAATRFREALSLWHGPALVDLVQAGHDWPEARQLDERRLDALESRVEADLRRGRHREVAAELEWLMLEHPAREGFYRQHILAAQSSGRGADAAETYLRARSAIATHHGRSPGEPLERAHRTLLTRRRAAVPEVDRPRPVGGRELRRVVVLCLRFEPGDGPVPWPEIQRRIGESDGHTDEPGPHLVTAYYGLFEARPDDLTRAVACAGAVRETPGVPALAAAIMTGVVLSTPHDRDGSPACWVSGEVVAECQNRVRDLSLGSTWMLA